MACVVSICGVACGSADRPAPAGDSLGDRDVAMEVAEAWRETDGTPAPDRRRTCERGSSRACRTYYTDESGQLHCPESLELCRGDGSAWLPCGEYFYDEQGRPVDRDGKPPPAR